MSNYTETKISKYIDGSEFWFKNGKLHREDGPAVKLVNGTEEWYKNGEFHRVNGPAYSDHGYEAWYKNGKCHREDGPAIKYVDGSESWYLCNKSCFKQEYKLVPISYRINIIYE